MKINRKLSRELKIHGEVILQSNYCDVITGVVIVVDLILTCIDIDLRAAGVDTPLWIELCSGACCLALQAGA